MSRLRSGAVVGGRYLLEKKLGRGGVGEVWSAIDTTHALEVALKFLQRTSPTAEERARFVREGNALARIDSPFVCRVLDTPQPAPGEPSFLVIERLHGQLLDEVLTGGKTLPFHEICRLIDALFQGTAAAHAVGVVHRDIKPSNIVMVGETDRVAKIIDFGIAKLVLNADAKLTTRGAMLGSPHYMAPEQLVDAMGADERCDIYSVATVAFRALTGTIPFRSGNVAELLTLKRGHRAATLAEVTQHSWPAPLERFFTTALARGRDERPESALEARELFRDACVAVGDAFGVPRRSVTNSPKIEPKNEGEIEGEEADTPTLVRSRP